MHERSVTNTTDQMQNPAARLGFLAESLATGSPSSAIENQERAGQAELLNSTVLPRVNHTAGDGRGDAAFEALGFVFGDPVPGDDLFRQAQLPNGWTREGSDHAMQSYILDERGVRRVSVFYKAAFYDRKASMSLVNVGATVARDFIYGDEATPHIPSGLTAEELADAKVAAHMYVADADKHPDIYGDRLPRAKTFIATIEARS